MVPGFLKIFETVAHYGETIALNFSDEKGSLLFSECRSDSSSFSFNFNVDADSIRCVPAKVGYSRTRSSTRISSSAGVVFCLCLDFINVPTFDLTPLKNCLNHFLLRFFICPLRLIISRLLSLFKSFDCGLNSFLMVRHV